VEHLGGTKTAGPIARRRRDLFMPMVLKRLVSSERMRWLYDHQIDWERRVADTQAAA
jgi:hypothetical protein